MQHLHGIAVHINGRQRLALKHVRNKFDDFADRTNGTLHIGLQQTMPDHALAGVHVDQDQRPVGELPDLGDDRSAQRHRHCSDFHAFKRERNAGLVLFLHGEFSSQKLNLIR